MCKFAVLCAGKPIAPVGPLTIRAFSHDSVTLSWRAPDGVEAWSISGYRVEKREVRHRLSVCSVYGLF